MYELNETTEQNKMRMELWDQATDLQQKMAFVKSFVQNPYADTRFDREELKWMIDSLKDELDELHEGIIKFGKFAKKQNGLD